MRKFFLVTIFIGFFCFTSVSQGGLGSLFQKILRPVFELSEKILGQAIAASVKLQYGEWKSDPETQDYVQGIFKKIIGVADRRDLKWSLTILKPDFVNAFAVPGGHIYITRGLLQKIKTDDELAAVLGHEVGHVVAKHSMKSIKHQLAYQFIINKLNKRSDKLRTLGQVYSVFAGLRYSRKNEHEADYYGARYAALAGFNPQGMVDFLGVLKKINPKEPNRIETSIRSHPPTSRRIRRMEEYMTSFPAEHKRPRQLSYDYSAKYPSKAKSEKNKVSKIVSEPDSLKSTSSTADTAKTTPSKIIVYKQSFDESNSFGVSKGLKITQDQGIYILDSKTKYSGRSSQRLASYRPKNLGLVTAEITVKSGTRYRATVFIKTKNVTAKPSPIGYGACINITELSDRQYLGSHYGLFSKTGSSGKFQKLKFEFDTRKSTSKITVEFALRGARGQAWFDDFQLEEL